MDSYQEIVAERIIDAHKAKKGVYDWDKDSFDKDQEVLEELRLGKNYRECYEQLEIIKGLLQERGLIAYFDVDRTRLTSIGFAFKGFEEERKARLKTERQQRKESWPKRNWYVLPLFTYGLGLLTPIIQKSIEQKITVTKNTGAPATPGDVDNVSDSLDKENKMDTLKKGLWIAVNNFG